MRIPAQPPATMPLAGVAMVIQGLMAEVGYVDVAQSLGLEVFLWVRSRPARSIHREIAAAVYYSPLRLHDCLRVVGRSPTAGRGR